MGKLALQLVFIVAGLNFTILKLGTLFHTLLGSGESPRAVAMVFCLPAVVLGSMSWWTVRSFARSWCVIACVLIAWAGLLYAEPTQSNRGVVGAAWLTITLPIAALLVKHRCWWLCAKTYVLASACAMGMAIWFEYQMSGTTLLGSLQRFGMWMSDDGGSRLANPNRVGGQLALAAVLALMLYLKDGRPGRGTIPSAGRPRRFSIGWTVFLSLGCLLTASRAAFVAWLAGMALLLCAARVHESRKLRDLVAVTSILGATGLFLVFAVDFRPWQSLASRLDNPHQVLTASGRVTLWTAALDVWCSDQRHFLIGAGNGSAPEAIGRHLHLTERDGFTPAGMDAHSSFVEWGLSHGLLGIVAAGCLAAIVFRRAGRQDRRGGTVFRRTILLCFCLISMNYVTYRDLIILAAGPLILAMVSQAPPAVPMDVPLRPAERHLPKPRSGREGTGASPGRRYHAGQVS